MPATSVNPNKSKAATPDRTGGTTRRAQGVIAWSSFFFSLLQSLCTFFATVNGLRLAIGIGALAVSSSVGAAIRWFHSDLIRLPMVVLALIGSLLNLVVLWQVRRLRSRPAAKWRQTPVSAGKIGMERVQFLLSIATLVLLGIEEYWHLTWHHHL
jgi:uncharacterized membrane protein